MHLTQTQRSEVITRVEEFVYMARSLYGSDMPVPTVEFTKRGTTAGVAQGSDKVNFNAVLLAENWDEFMNDTIPHEVAHCVVNYVWGPEIRYTRRGKPQRMSHGPKWKGVMRDFGCEPNRTHSMDVSNARQGRRTKTKYEYVCQNCGASVPVGPKYHKDLQNGRKLKHKCAGRGQRGELVYKGVIGKITYAEAAQGMKAPAKAPKKAAKTTPTAPRKGTQIAHAVEIYKAMTENVDTHYGRQDIIKAIMNSMQVNLQKASGLHDRAKKKVAA